MTWITDNAGTRWVEPAPRKRRKPARALRFDTIKVGDQLARKWKYHTSAQTIWYYLVTDLWFDPVAGQRDETAGRMAAIQMIDSHTGELRGRKEAHTLRGLASQGFNFASLDYIAHVRATRQAMSDGAVVGIRHAHAIRARPKLPASRL